MKPRRFLTGISTYYQSRRQLFLDTAPAHNARLHSRLTTRRFASPTERAADLAVAEKTAKERRKGVVVGPYSTPADLHRAFTHLFSHLPPSAVYPRIMNRFGIEQKGAIRAIDDGRSNGANAVTPMAETVSTPSFFYPAVFARAVAVASSSLRLPFLALTVSLADLSKKGL